MKNKRFIYATNRSQVIYKFVIIDETETEYVVNDANTSSYELSQVKFYINKENLCIARCDEKRWAFIVTEEFFASFELKDVGREFYKRQITLIESEISRKETELLELEYEHHKKVKKPYNTFFSFNDFKLNDKIYVLYENNLYETKVVSFVTLDKINFVPNIDVCFGNIIEDYAELKQGENGKLYIDVTEHNYDDIEYNNHYKVFLSRMDYDVYLEMVEYANEIEKINNKISLEIGHFDRAYMIGYNDACEKVLEWLREEFNDIFTTKNEWLDINSDEFLDKFQQSLHPYSVEQIDNCVNMK